MLLLRYLWNLPSFGGVALNPYNTTWTSVFAYQVPFYFFYYFISRIRKLTFINQLDIWITTTQANSPNPTGDILSNYVDTTGHAPSLPYFASGFWQCKVIYINFKLSDKNYIN